MPTRTDTLFPYTTPFRSAGVGAVGVFVEFAFGMAPVHAEAQDMVGADRRAQLDLAAEPGRGRVALIEDELVARRTDHLVGEVARLEIGERIELPAAAMDEIGRAHV